MKVPDLVRITGLDNDSYVGRKGFIVLTVNDKQGLHLVAFTNGESVLVHEQDLKVETVKSPGHTKRISRNKYFMDIARLTARRSPCKSRQVGAVVVIDNRIVGTGYNGPPAGMRHCITCVREKPGQSLEACPAIHAEENAIKEALKSMGRIGLYGATIYATTQPCIFCLKSIIHCDIKKIVYLQEYRTTLVRDQLLAESGVLERQYSDEDEL